MKRGIKIGLTVVMIVSILGLGLIGCAKPAPAPAPAPAPKPTPTPTPAAPKVYKLKFSTHHSLTDFRSEAATLPFIEAVKERSGGRIAIDLYPGQSLAKYPMLVEALRTGVADMGYFTYTFHPDLFPLQQVLALPSLNKTSYEFLKIFRGVNDEYFKPIMDKLGLVDIGTVHYPNMFMFTTRKPVYRLEDFKGLTLIGFAAPTREFLANQLGGVPIFVGGAETFDTLQKGIADGVIVDASSVGAWKWYETGKPGYWHDLGQAFPAGSLSAGMSKAVYDSLPADLRKIIDEAAREFLFEAGSRAIDRQNTTAVKAMREYGTKIITWEEAEAKRLEALFMPMWDDWAKATDAHGLPGSKLVAAMRALAAK